MSDDKDFAVMGFDIMPMSSHANENELRLAATLLLPNGTEKKWDNIPRRKLMQLIHAFKPKYLATDNPQEILLKRETLPQFCKRLPPVTNLVHVNGLKNGKTISIMSLFRKYELIHGKPTPMQTSRGLALLAKKGIGTILDPFEDETIIKIGQPRRTRKGGWSQQRYARQNEEVVLHATEKIKDILIRNKVAYDFSEIRTKYGLKQAKFHTFLPRTRIGELFAGVNLKPAKITFISPSRKILVRKPISYRFDMKHPSFHRRVIVGIDPGTTIGIAVMDLDGKVLDVFSQRDMTKADIIQYLSDFGIPVAFCADVYPIPNLISKLAATFDAEIFSPRIELSKVDKRDLAKKAGVHFSNNHEIDALAAVVKGYNFIRSKMEKITRMENLDKKQKDVVKGLVIRGLTIADAVEAVNSIGADSKPTEVVRQDYEDEVTIRLQNRIKNLLKSLASSESTIGYLREQVMTLETMLNEERKQKGNIHEALFKARDANVIDALTRQLVQEKSREIQYLRKAVARHTRTEKQLRKRVQELQKALWISMQEGKYPIKVLPVFSQKGFDKLEEEVTLKRGDIILIHDASGGGPQTANRLVDIRPRMVFLNDTEFAPEAEAILRIHGIPFLDAEPYNIQVFDSVAIIDPLYLEKAIRDWEELRVKEKKINTVQEFLAAVENYRFERRRFFEEIQPSYDDFDPEEFERRQRKNGKN
ncbi:MAG: DUF460 domain-containing protein [Methanobacteriota archaeon]|nr:MAG: DUF460 domain-containing protein [Euryarchaeota archaeon]